MVEVGGTDDGDGIRGSGEIEDFAGGDRSGKEGEMVGWVVFGEVVGVEGGHDGQSGEEGMVAEVDSGSEIYMRRWFSGVRESTQSSNNGSNRCSIRECCVSQQSPKSPNPFTID